MRIAAVQLCVGDDPDANLDQIRPLVAAAAADGARVVALPENALYMGPTAGKLALAGPLTAENRHFAAFSGLAASHGCWLLVGGFPEASPDAARPYNTAFLLDPTGALARRYRKLHLFDVDLPGGPRLCESEHTRPGDTAVVARVDETLVGLTICYDLRFPELFRTLVVAAGARVVFVPSAFTVPTGRAHWHVLLRARAIENQCWIIAPAQGGRHPPGDRTTYGHTLIVNPWGEIVAELGEGLGHVVAECDLASQDTIRRQLPALTHRRAFEAPDQITNAAASAPGSQGPSRS